MSGKWKNKGQTGPKPGSGKAFVIPDRKHSVPMKPQAQNVQGKQTNGGSKAFVIPDRKQINKTSSEATAQAVKPKNRENNKFVTKQRTCWWDSNPVLTENDLIKFEEGQAWHANLPYFLDEISANGQSFNLHSDKLTAAAKAINAAYQQQLKLYADWLKNNNEMKGDVKWMNDMIKSGTMSDKVAAMALKVQSSPFHELDTLDTLMGMALRKEQRSAQLAMEALKDLFVNNLLPERTLRSMDNNGLNHAEMDLKTAQLVWFESQIKARYEKLLEALDLGLKSNVDYFKRECLQTVSELLIGKPEQESRLLAMLVNKLGDPSRATCSKAVEVLKQVMRAHPAMKIVIVREVRQFLYRPNLKIRPVFNGIILLAQVQLNSKADHNVAVQLVEGYLSLFEKTMKEEEYGSRLLSALLTGINKALPFLQNTDSLEKYVDPLFKIVHTATSFSTATQALMLLSHLALSHPSTSPTAASAGANAGAPDALSSNAESREVGESAIVKRYYRALYAKLLSEQITTRSRNTLFLNLLYRSIKGDVMQHRALAFIKRLLICAVQSVPPIAAGLLFLISEILKSRPSLKACLADVPEATRMRKDTSNENGGDIGYLGNFNVSKREPEFALDPDSLPSVWETCLLSRYYHPSVQSFSETLTMDPTHQIHFSGDPTVDFSLMSFLNRFAYKNPKKNTSEKIKHRTAQHATEEPVNITMSHADASAETVDPDKQFFFKYFSDKSKLVAAGRSRNKSKHQADTEESGDDDDSSVGDGGSGAESDPDEAAIDRYADKLAEDLMRSTGNNPDELDFSDDDQDSDDDESAVMGDMMGGEEEDDEQEEGEMIDESSDDEEGLDFDEGLEDSDDANSDDNNDGDDKIPVKRNNSKKKSNDGSSHALDFADFVLEQKSQKSVKSKKASKGKNDDDSSDDGYTGLVAYGDEGDEMALSGDPNDPEYDEESLLGEGSDEEDDEEDDDVEFDEEDYDSADDEALESAGFMDSDDDNTMNKKGKGKRNLAKNDKKMISGKSKRSTSTAFASAEDYEDMMEDIVQKVSRPTPSASTKPATTKPAATTATLEKGNNKRKGDIVQEKSAVVSKAPRGNKKPRK